MTTGRGYTPSKVGAAINSMQPASETVMLTVRVPVEVSQLFDELAEQQGTSKSTLIRQAFIDYLERLQPEAMPA